MERAELPTIIDTARLRLRPWALTDVDDVFGYASDPEWARYLRFLPTPYKRTDAEEFVAGQVALDRTTHPAWAITLDGVGIGGINLRFSFEHALAELGYSLARERWGRGLATEAAHGVIDAAFATHADLNRVRAFADARNSGSRRVLEKVGMTLEGILRQNRIERGEPLDEAWYGILRPEWEAGSRPSRQGSTR